MTKRDDGGQAFPVPAGNFSGGESWSSENGMSLRDYFAAKALIGLVANGNWPVEQFADTAYRIADAMLAEHGKPAATPMLLDALKDALLTLEAIKENWGDEHPGLDKTLAEEIDRTRAAIAKAEGR